MQEAHLYDIFVVATMENSGERPENLTNEIFSCFHHIARALCLSDKEGVDPVDELSSALSSHLKRATLDSYKIAINTYLEEDQKLKETLDYMVLAEDFTRFVPEGLQCINGINAKSKIVKDFYGTAKKFEASGEFDQAMAAYNNALESSIDLRDQISVFTENKSYLLASAREAKKQEERSADKKSSFKLAVTVAVITAVLSTGLPYVWQKYISPANADTVAPVVLPTPQKELPDK